MLECICVDGGIDGPIYHSQGDKVSVSWIPSWALELNWYFAASAKGWINNDRGFEWLTKFLMNLPTKKQKAGHVC